MMMTAITIDNVKVLELTWTTPSMAAVASSLPSGLKHTPKIQDLLALTRTLCDSDDVS